MSHWYFYNFADGAQANNSRGQHSLPPAGTQCSLVIDEGFHNFWILGSQQLCHRRPNMVTDAGWLADAGPVVLHSCCKHPQPWFSALLLRGCLWCAVIQHLMQRESRGLKGRPLWGQPTLDLGPAVGTPPTFDGQSLALWFAPLCSPKAPHTAPPQIPSFSNSNPASSVTSI